MKVDATKMWENTLLTILLHSLSLAKSKNGK